MTDTLFQAYFPLLFWTGLGLLLFRFLPSAFPRLLGRSLYWVGVPLQIFTLARQTNFSGNIGLAPAVAVAALVVGLSLGWTSLQGVRWLSLRLVKTETDPPASHWLDRSRQGSFILSSMIGNTGFVGLAIAPFFIPDQYLGWLVFYSITQNVVGTYGIGVFLASYYGRQGDNHWWVQLRDVLTVPSLWAFALGSLTRSIKLPDILESGLHASLWVIIPSALLLMGMRLRQLQGWKSLQLALVPAGLKVLVIPTLVGLTTTLMHLSPEPRLALVLMSGMPTAFAGLILAEEYDLDRELIASSIVLTTLTLLLTIPVWLFLFG